MTLPRINLLTWAIMCWTLAGTILIAACEQGWSISRANETGWPRNLETAHLNVAARGTEWLEGIRDIDYVDQPPPRGVNAAVVECPGTVVVFNTMAEASVETLEGLLVHEAFEIQHGCRDQDQLSARVVRCYREGKPHRVCVPNPVQHVGIGDHAILGGFDVG